MEEVNPPAIKQKTPEKQKKQDPPVKPKEDTPPKPNQKSPVRFGKLLVEDSEGLLEENRKIRTKLKELSKKLDKELERAAEHRLREQHQRITPPTSEESQQLELQNARKIIDRLQRTVKSYQSKQAYHVTLKRVMDLQGIVHKKDIQIDELKIEIRTQQRIVKERQRQIQELIENSQQESNPTEGLQTIKKLKMKLQKLGEECQTLRKKEQEKHDKLVAAELRIAELEAKNRAMPAESQQAALQRELKHLKDNYHEAVQRLERQNVQISKLNQKLALQAKEKAKRRKQRKEQPQEEQSQKEETERQLPHPRKNYAVSLDALPKAKPKAHFNQFPEVMKSWK